ncbi:MAG: hypothetical protein AAF675_00735 [Pseudomonadota bacterium]
MSPLLRSPFSTLASERLAGIGHNGGPPLDAAVSWRRHCWKVARQTTLPSAPLEVVRRRVARARALGLAYPAYASILAGTGRDVRAMLFTAGALALTVSGIARRVALDEERAARLRALEDCGRLIMVPEGTGLDGIGAALGTQGIAVLGVGEAPDPEAGFGPRRESVARLLAGPGLPADTVVMVGAAADERATAEAGRLAKFLAADLYFARPGV